MSSILTFAYTAASKNKADPFVDSVAREYPEVTIERIELVDGANPTPSGAAVAVLFDNDFSTVDSHTVWLTKWNQDRAKTPLLPIALGSHGKPPEPIGALKSRFAVDDEKEILRSIGAMLGLALRPGKNKIFVSYRSIDGRTSATKIYDHLISRGYCAWLDEGKDVDDNPNLELGRAVQDEIEERLTKANAVILVDTPQAPDSYWVREEMNIAVGKMIPIYPLVLHPSTEESSRGRFRVLQGLHRRICIETHEDDNGQITLPDESLDRIVDSVESYLKRVYQNRIVQPREMERWFNEQKWEFGVSDLRPHLHHGKAGKIPNIFSLLACCSFEDIIFAPRLYAFVEDIKYLCQNNRAYTRNLYLYPGATRNEIDIEYIMTKEVPALATQNALLLSYNEAIARISSMTGGYNA